MQFLAKPRVYRKPMYESDMDRLYDALGFAKTAFPSQKSKMILKKKAHKLYPIFKDDTDRILYVKVGVRRAVVRRFFRVFVDGEYAYTEFECEQFM